MSHEGKMLNGRQIYWLCLQELERPTIDAQVGTMEDLLELTLDHDNLRKYQTDWDRALLAIPNKPDDDFLKLLYNRQIKKSKQFEQTMLMYSINITQNGAPKTYQQLYDMVEKFLDDKRKQRNNADENKWYSYNAQQNNN